jgi:hypothetical protein
MCRRGNRLIVDEGRFHLRQARIMRSVRTYSIMGWAALACFVAAGACLVLLIYTIGSD